MVEWWIKAFPEVCFSFNRSINNFKEEQIEALVKMEDRRVLLETDAPYFIKKGHKYSSPNQIYDVAEMVSKYRKKTVKEILELTKNNALRLYNCNQEKNK